MVVESREKLDSVRTAKRGKRRGGGEYRAKEGKMLRYSVVQ